LELAAGIKQKLYNTVAVTRSCSTRNRLPLKLKTNKDVLIVRQIYSTLQIFMKLMVALKSFNKLIKNSSGKDVMSFLMDKAAV
jgi:hypothetical protein